MSFLGVSKKATTIGLALIVIAFALFVLIQTIWHRDPNWITAIVEKGAVTETVSVSGFIEAKNTAELTFPTLGTVTEVFVNEGQQVTQGEVLATLASTQLVALRNDATAQLRIAQAQYDKLIEGASDEVRATSNTTVQNAQKNLERIMSEEKEKVTQARKQLLSSALIAQATDSNEDAAAPLVTGSYTCDREGTYELEVYNSNAQSGFSYKYTGLESGTSPAGLDQPASLGACGLYLQFSDGDSYNLSTWTIPIPNTQSTAYITNANTYALALEKQANAVAQANDVLLLAQLQAKEVSATARPEEVREAAAIVDKAYANIASVDAQMDDRSIVAPFDGIVTNVAIIAGETAPNTPVITMLKKDAFELKARIPEIDVTKIEPNQNVSAVFDAESKETYNGKVTYLSPLATLIDGVAYFEAIIALDTTPSWVRSGLNADVEIFIKKQEGVLRIPKRFIFENTLGVSQVYVDDNNKKTPQDVTVLFSGNDGFVAVSGIEEGTLIIAP